MNISKAVKVLTFFLVNRLAVLDKYLITDNFYDLRYILHILRSPRIYHEAKQILHVV